MSATITPPIKARLFLFAARESGSTELHVPLKYASFLWGWPDRFLNRMDEGNTRVIVVAGEGKCSEGFDSADDIKHLPAGYSGGIWTNRIDRIAPLRAD